MLDLPWTTVLGAVLVPLGLYSVIRVRRDHAAYHAAVARMQVVDGIVARYQRLSVSASPDTSTGDMETFGPIVKYVVDRRAYELPMPWEDSFRSGPTGQVVKVAYDPAHPEAGRFLEPRDKYAVYSSAAVTIVGLVLLLRDWLAG
jgi:hypothetical protein